MSAEKSRPGQGAANRSSFATASDSTATSIPHVTPFTADRPMYEVAMQYGKAGLYIAPTVKYGASPGKNPGAALGGSWPTKTVTGGADAYAMFAEQHSDAAGVAMHCGRSGLIVVDIDTEDESIVPEPILRAIKECEPPYQTTRIGAVLQGHYVFAQPPGREIGNSGGKLGADWGDVRGKNGVVILAGSWHVREDGEYAWQRTGSVPVLPDYVADLLPNGTDSQTALSDAEVSAFLDQHVSDMKRQALNAVVTHFRENSSGHGRHTTMVKAVTWAMRDAIAGIYPARYAATVLLKEMSDAVAGERDVDSEMRGIFAWAIPQAKQATPERLKQIRDRLLSRESLPEGETGEKSSDVVVASPNLPVEFWESRDSLRLIRATAHARNRSADAALAGVLAYYAASVKPDLGPDTGIGGGGVSLNLYAAVVARSGAGKSSGVSVAKMLIPEHIGDMLEHGRMSSAPLGSGEGLAEAYMGTRSEEVEDTSGKKKTKAVRTKVRDHAVMHKDEGAELVLVMERQGSTIGESLRSAWSGETFGQQNGRAETTRIVRGGTYSLGLTIGFQEEAAAPLFSERNRALGMSQRFLWFSAEDPTITGARNDDFVSVRLKGTDPYDAAASPFEPARMTIETSIKDRIWVEDTARQNGEIQVAPLDSHKPLTLVKVASLLALIEGSNNVSEEDWRLAEMVWASSCAVRSRILAHEQRRKEKESRNRLKTQREMASAQRQGVLAVDELRTMEAWIMRQLEAEELTAPGLTRKQKSAKRQGVVPALEGLVKLGKVLCTGDKYKISQDD